MDRKSKIDHIKEFFLRDQTIKLIELVNTVVNSENIEKDDEGEYYDITITTFKTIRGVGLRFEDDGGLLFDWFYYLSLDKQQDDCINWIYQNRGFLYEKTKNNFPHR